MRILLCDDNPFVTEQLTKYLHTFFSQNKFSPPEIVSYPNGDSLLKDTGNKDIVFLDIEMPGVDGIYVGNKLKQSNPHTIIIVITSFTEYLDDAMRFHVFRYLSKPIDKQRLYRNLKEALQLFNSRSRQIALETKEGIFSINTSDIVCIEAQDRKVIIHTVSKDYESIHNLNVCLTLLKDDSCFIQTHRSFIINLAHITNFNNSEIHLYNNQFTAYLTRRNYKEFKSTYFLYLESMR